MITFKSSNNLIKSPSCKMNDGSSVKEQAKNSARK